MIEILDMMGRDPKGRTTPAGIQRVVLAGKSVGFLFPSGVVSITKQISEAERVALGVAINQHTGKQHRILELSPTIHSLDEDELSGRQQVED